MSTLLLRLAGPLQAWGTDSHFNKRHTESVPSKSGIIGLLAAALGLPRNADLTPLRGLRFGVRTDQEGVLLRDFQTVHIQKREAPEVTDRFYLSDAVFLVGLQDDNELLVKELADALRAPVWALYLGRRSCPPTQPLVVGIRDLPLDEALSQEPWQVSEWKKTEWKRRHPGKLPLLPILTDMDGNGYGSTVVPDDPISFDQKDRRFALRMMEGKPPVTPPDCYPISDLPTEHDAFSELEES